MELKFEKTPCRCLRSLTREIQNVEQTQELRLPDGMPDVGRVLCAWGQAMLRSKEWRGDGMSASGGVMVWVLYAPEDGSSPQCVDIWLPFNAKWNFSETEREGMIRIAPLIRSVDARMISARKLMIRASLGICGEALEPCEVQVCTPGQVPEGLELLKNTYPVRLPKEAGEKAFVLDEELSLPGSCPAMEKPIRFELTPQLADVRVLAGKVVFRGTGLLSVLYCGDDGSLHTWHHEIPFSQFADLEEDFGTDADARITFALTNLELDRMEDGSVRLKCGLVAQYVIEDQMLLELTEDAYSPHREVTPEIEEVKLPSVLDRRRDQVNCEATLDAECAKIVDLCFLPDHPSLSRVGDRISNRLTGVFQLCYEDLNGNLQGVVRRWEQERMLDAAADSVVCVEVSASGVPAAQLGARGVTMKCDMNLEMYTKTSRGQCMMTGIALGDIKKPDRGRPSVILRRMEGERLWDLAKRCGTTVQAICQANGLKDEPDPGRLLLIPVL